MHFPSRHFLTLSIFAYTRFYTKPDGVTTQHITIYYNCIGAFSVPDRRNIPAVEITMGTRKGVAVSYSRSRIAV
ncbi:hypothetical protein [Flintibacter muris]|uniref:hypothetical protein n=1 Tax=Flintibacter muris TaxID=2941327 RepID=UPI0020419483|nr:hypothetical protein [Flintibacter muris]